MLDRIMKLWLGSMVFLLMLTVCVPAIYSNPLPSVPGEFNGIFFRNSEVLIDEDSSGTISVGDIFWGVLQVNEIAAPTDQQGQTGPRIWPLSGVPPAEITGYFAIEVVATYVVGHPSNPFFEDLIILGPAVDPNGILAPGEVIRIYEDTNFNFNDSTQGSALASATDGTLLWSFGLGSGGGSPGGYWYTVAPVAPPGSGDVGESYAGLNVITAPPGDAFGLVNDPNEDFSSGAGVPGGLDVQFWFNSEIFRLPLNPGLTIDPDDPMHFGSNDPAVYKPVEGVPCTLAVDKKCSVSEPGDFVCSDAKPIDTLTMIWSGTETIKVVAHKGKKVNDPVVGTVNNIMVGDEVTISGFGGKTDVMWEIFQDGTDNKIGESIFHLSCSDQDMNGPEDCGKPQGDGKNKAGFLNDWLFEGMAGDLTLDCDPTPPVGSDQCTIPAGGDNVEYTYKVTNTGSEAVFDVTVVDDQIGTVPGSPIGSLAPGAEETLTATQFVTESTTNVVTVTGETAAGATCSATDSAEVIVEPLPFECDKPIKELTMIWDGTEEIRIKAWKGKVGSTLLADIDNIMPEDEVTVDGFTGKPNDVIWEIFEANSDTKIGESKFHLSCSDPDMNGPEDCGKREGDGKKNESKYINDWLLEGMVDKTSSFDCTP